MGEILVGGVGVGVRFLKRALFWIFTCFLLWYFVKGGGFECGDKKGKNSKMWGCSATFRSLKGFRGVLEVGVCTWSETQSQYFVILSKKRGGIFKGGGFSLFLWLDEKVKSTIFSVNKEVMWLKWRVWAFMIRRLFDHTFYWSHSLVFSRCR